jgi:hypothetical protein
MEQIDTLDTWNCEKLSPEILGKFAARLESLSDVEL